MLNLAMTGLGRLVVAVGGATFLTGCPNPNTFGTPRTVPKGKFNHIIAAEGASLSSTSTYTVNGQSTSSTDSVTLPMFPSYHLRYGVSDDVDMGFKVLNLDSLGVDVKWNFERGDDVDLAINPAVQGAYFSVGDASLGLLYFHLPLLVGFNLSDNVTLVATPGVTYLLATSTVFDSGASTQEQAVSTGSALLGRLGIGLNARVADKFALQPEITAMRGFNDAKDTYFTFGLGFIIGPHPIYGPARPQ